MTLNAEDKETSQQLVRKFWGQYLEGMAEFGDFVEQTAVVDSPQAAIEAADYLMMTLASAYILMTRGDPDNPEFMPWLNNVVFPYGGANPDTCYYYATISGEGIYRIQGYRNSVSWVDFMTGHDYPGFAEVPGKAYPSTQIDDYVINEDGSFEILLSNVRPVDHTGNWIKLESNVDYLIVRQCANAPDEIDARMAIERVDRNRAPKMYDSGDTERKLHEVMRHARISSQTWPRYPRLTKGAVNEIPPLTFGDTGAVWGQMYHQGRYQIGLNEAMVMEFKVPPKCRNWSIQIADLFWRSLDCTRRCSNLNGYPGLDRADGDGITRLVIAHRDAGIDNWVDACGVTEGDIMMRWLYVQSAPELTIKVMPFDKVLMHLPADTRRIDTPQRELQLRKRAMARQLRRSW